MVKIIVADHLGRCYSNEDGQKLYDLIKRELQYGNKVTVSFEGIDTVTSSFVNSALIELLNDHSFETIKAFIKFEGTRKSIGNLIKSRFDFEVYKRDNSDLPIMA
jgi:hypothetical protein